MNRKSIAKVLDRLWRGFCRFWAFNLCAIAVTAVYVLANHDFIGEEVYKKVSQGVFWGALSGLFAQLCCEWRAWPRRRLVVGLVTVAVGALGCWFWFALAEGMPGSCRWLMLYHGSCFSLFAASVAVLYRIADERTVVSRLTLNALGASGAAAILFASLSLCILAFDKLVASVSYKLYIDVMGVVWLLVFPIGFLSFLPSRDQRDETSDRAVAFLFWLLLPASMILLVILYLYLGKIVLTRSMPSGTLNWFGSVALAVYAFFWLALRDSARAFFRLFVRWGWALLLPVLAAQVVGIVIRYQAYGLTTPRLAGMVTLSFGIVALVLAALNRHPQGLFAFVAAAGLVFTISPLNIVDVPIRNQEARLRAALSRNGLLQEDGETLSLKPGAEIPETDAMVIVGAWQYLVKDSSWRVWHRPAFTDRLREAVAALGGDSDDKDASLPKLLGLDERKYTRKAVSSSDRTMRFRLPRKEAVSIDGYSRLRPLECWSVSCKRHKDRWIVSIPGECSCEKDEFDVTDSVERILNSARGDASSDDRTLDLRAEDAVWPLCTESALIVSEVNFTANGGRPPTRLGLSCRAVVMRAKPQP